MTDLEFRAVLEANALAAHINEWSPTDEELHRLFWIDYQPPPQAAPPAVVRAEWATGLSAADPVAAPAATAPRQIPEAARELRWRIEVQGGDGFWYPVQGTDSSSDQFLEMIELPQHRRAQPHATFRIISYRLP